MVSSHYPDFNVVFEDPMYSLIFRTRDYNTSTRLIFCEESIRRSFDVQVVTLNFKLNDSEYSQEEFLLRQLNTIKSFLKDETTAIQFSTVCRELLFSKSKYLYDIEHEQDQDICNTFKSFELRYPYIWNEISFIQLVNILCKFVISDDLVVAKIKQGDENQILTTTMTSDFSLLWVKDDGSIMVLVMPMQSSDPDTQYSVDLSGSYYECKVNTMITKTWTEMFSSIPQAECKNAGVVFFIKNNTIRYIYHRNVNAFDSDWNQKSDQPVLCCAVDSAMSEKTCKYWRQSRIETRIKKVHISDGYNLNYLMETIANSIDRDLLVPHPRLILYLFLSVVILKYRYSFCKDFASKFFSVSKMFKPEKLHRMLEVWTCFIAGQEIKYGMKMERLINSKYRIYEIELHDVVQGDLKRVKRLVSWQFIPEEENLHVYDSFRPHENGYALFPIDDIGNPYDIRSKVNGKISDFLLRIDTRLNEFTLDSQ